MVDRSSSKRCVPIRVRLAVYNYRAINLIGKELSCRESRCRIMADIARKKYLKLFVGKSCYR